jgi:hypothetical protein
MSAPFPAAEESPPPKTYLSSTDLAVPFLVDENANILVPQVKPTAGSTETLFGRRRGRILVVDPGGTRKISKYPSESPHLARSTITPSTRASDRLHHDFDDDSKMLPIDENCVVDYALRRDVRPIEKCLYNCDACVCGPFSNRCKCFLASD